MNLYYVGSAIGLSALYMLAGTGSITALKAGEFNLGGEGQIYAGGFVCAILLNQCSKIHMPAFFAITLGFLAAAGISALLSYFSSILKNYKNASPLFTTFIISAAVIPLIDGLIAGPLRTTSGNLLSTAFLPQNYRFKSIIPPSTCSPLIFVAILVCIAFYFLFDRTSFGRKTCIMGVSNEFSKYSGYNNFRLRDCAFLISGSLHGICGAAAVFGTYYTCHSGFYAGMGWNALSAALIASSNPILLIPSSLILSFIITYANKFALFNNLGFDISTLIQGIVLLLIAFCMKNSSLAITAENIKLKIHRRGTK